MKENSSYFYEEEAALYDEKRYFSQIGKVIDLIQKKIVLELCDFTNGDIILDVGSGTGRFTIELAKKHGRVIGVDPSKAMIMISKKRVDEENLQEQVEFIIANAQMLPFRTKSIQKCISINVLNHIIEYEAALSEIVRVMQIRSEFLANYPIIQSLYFPIGVYVSFFRKDIQHRVFSRWFKLGKIRTFYSKFGLAIDESRGYISPAFPFSNKFSRFVSRLIFNANKLVKNSILKYVSGVLFFKAIKVG